MDMLEKLFSLKNKVVVVTGGARGIGKVVGEYLAAAGADIVILDVLEDLAKQTAASIAEKHKVRTAVYKCDVSDIQQVRESINNAGKKMGTLDLLFNNAGILKQGHAHEVDPEVWKSVVDVN